MSSDCFSNLLAPNLRPSVRVRLADLFARWWPSLSHILRPKPAHETAAFSAAVIALAAKMAKADGVAVRLECDSFERFFEPSADELPRVRRLYALASQDTAGFEAYAQSIARMLEGRPDLKVNVVECLLMIACADGVLHPAEEAFLRTVGETFGISCERFRKIRARFVNDMSDPYNVLGVAPTATQQEIRARYLELVRRFHPDQLIARGAQAAIVKAATVKMAAINAAYELVGRPAEGERA